MSAWIALLLIPSIFSAVAGSPIIWPETKDTSYRLVFEETPTPVKYVVDLIPDLANSTFTGHVVLTVRGKGINNIKLHAKNITVHNVSVKEADTSVELANENFSLDEMKEFLIIPLSTSLTPNKNYIIIINYEGILHDDMYGFYKSSYVFEGELRSIAATQFQPTHARKAFPCFDEPKYKAVFKITIRTPKGYTSLCNTPVEEKRDEGEWIDYVFEDTPVMSTYLVAFVVSDFTNLTVMDQNIIFKTWARSNAIEAGYYSIQVTPPILQELESYTNIPYNYSGLNKVDQVALPDFSAGAMENWGLITYRETALLFADGISPSNAKQRIATVISHELAHMWFGNLVTTDWWDSTWLNEGFATYFENYITSKVETSMRIMDQFVVNVQQAVFGADGLRVAQPLTKDCNTPSEVSAMFSSITYSKGGSVLRMFSHSLTEEKFQAALRNYLNERQFSTTEPDHLIKHLSEQAKSNDFTKDINFKEVVESWTKQPGYPVIKVTRNYNTNSSTVSQSHFLLNPGDTPDNQTWYVPLNWASSKEDFQNTKPRAWLKTESMEIEGLPSADKWVIFNIQETGYYRVNYDEDNWELLATALDKETESIHLLNRAQLVDDALNLARIGNLPYATTFKIIKYLAKEKDYIPWLSGLNGLSFLNRRLQGHADYHLFKEFVLDLLKTIHDELGYNDNGEYIEKLHRSVILSWACDMGKEECLKIVSERLQDFVVKNETVKPDLQRVVYCYGLKNSDGSEAWDFLWKRYKESNDAFEKTLLLSSLGCTNNQTILKNYLHMSIEGDIRKQDAASVFSAVYNNPEGVETALNFLSDNFIEISEYYGSMGGIGNIVRGLAAQITDENQKEKFEKFLEENKEDLGSAKVTAEQTVTENLSWSKKYQEEIFKELKGKEDNGGSDSSTILSPGLATFFTALSLCILYLY